MRTITRQKGLAAKKLNSLTISGIHRKLVAPNHAQLDTPNHGQSLPIFRAFYARKGQKFSKNAATKQLFAARKQLKQLNFWGWKPQSG